MKCIVKIFKRGEFSRLNEVESSSSLPQSGCNVWGI